MGASTNTITTRPRSKAWHRIVALVLAAGSLAVPAAASAATAEDYLPASPAGSTESSDGGYSSVSSIVGGASQPSPVSGAPGEDSGFSSLNAITGATPSEPTLVSGPSSTADDGFDWASAAIGASAILGLMSLTGAVLLSVRRRTTVSTASLH